jgi:L-aspartate oxidase
MVFSRRAGRAVLRQVAAETGDLLPRLPAWRLDGAVTAKEQVVFDHNWDALRRVMWDYIGIVRNDERLARAAATVALLRDQTESDYWRYRLDADLVELRNIGLVADLIVTCARRRKESRGLHYNVDHPRRDDRRFRRDTLLTRQDVR